MLYDFAMGQLDRERQAAVEDFLKTDKESQGILEGIRAGLAYAEQIGRLELKNETLQHIRESENAISLGRKYSSWSEWPDSLRWSITAITLSTVVAALVAVIPWAKLPSLKPAKKQETIQIAEIPHPNEQQIESVQEHQEGDTAAEEQGSGDEEGDDTDAPTPPSAIASRDEKRSAPAVKSVATAKTARAESADESDSESDESSSRGEEKLNAGNAASATMSKEAKPKGFVYRAFMTLSNLDELGPKITDNITELGGEKAGEVELGWKRGSGRYYHFAMPQENEEKLLEKLRAYGPVRISKDPHSRVMPPGQVRFILWVESAR